MAAIKILLTEDGIEDTALLFDPVSRATPKANNENTCLFTWVWHSCDFPNKIKGIFLKALLTFSWIRVGGPLSKR